MSEEIKRYRFKGAAGEYVYANYYDTAQSELAALREELLRLEEEYDTLEHANITLKLSLADAEQRNSELVELLGLIKRTHGTLLLTDPPQDPWKFYRIGERISAALEGSAQ